MHTQTIDKIEINLKLKLRDKVKARVCGWSGSKS